MAYQTNSVNGLTTHQNFERWVRTDDPDKLVFIKKGSNNNTPLSYGKGSSFYYNMNFFGNLNYKRTLGEHSIDAMAYAIKSQAALYAASPLWNAEGTSKYIPGKRR